MSLAISRAAASMMPLPRNGTTRMRGSRTVTRARPAEASAARSVARSRSPARRSGMRGVAVAARRQHAVAGIEASKASAPPAAFFTASNGATLSVSGRHRLPGFDALTAVRQQRGRIAAGAQACRRRRAPSRPAAPSPPLGRAGADASTAKVRPAACATSRVRGVTGFTSASISPRTSAKRREAPDQLERFADWQPSSSSR